MTGEKRRLRLQIQIVSAIYRAESSRPGNPAGSEEAEARRLEQVRSEALRILDATAEHLDPADGELAALLDEVRSEVSGERPTGG